MSKPKFRAYIEFENGSRINSRAYLERSAAQEQMIRLRTNWPGCTRWWVEAV